MIRIHDYYVIRKKIILERTIIKISHWGCTLVYDYLERRRCVVIHKEYPKMARKRKTKEESSIRCGPSHKVLKSEDLLDREKLWVFLYRDQEKGCYIITITT